MERKWADNYPFQCIKKILKEIGHVFLTRIKKVRNKRTVSPVAVPKLKPNAISHGKTSKNPRENSESFLVLTCRLEIQQKLIQ